MKNKQNRNEIFASFQNKIQYFRDNCMGNRNYLNNKNITNNNNNDLNMEINRENLEKIIRNNSKRYNKKEKDKEKEEIIFNIDRKGELTFGRKDSYIEKNNNERLSFKNLIPDQDKEPNLDNKTKDNKYYILENKNEEKVKHPVINEQQSIKNSENNSFSNNNKRYVVNNESSESNKLYDKLYSDIKLNIKKRQNKYQVNYLKLENDDLKKNKIKKEIISLTNELNEYSNPKNNIQPYNYNKQNEEIKNKDNIQHDYQNIVSNNQKDEYINYELNNLNIEKDINEQKSLISYDDVFIIKQCMKELTKQDIKKLPKETLSELKELYELMTKKLYNK